MTTPNNQDYEQFMAIADILVQYCHDHVSQREDTIIAILAWHNQQLEQAVIEARIDELRRLVPSPVAEMASIDHSDELIRLYEYINNRFAKLSKSKE